MLDLLEASQSHFRRDTQLLRTTAGWSSLAFYGNSDLLLLGSVHDDYGERPATDLSAANV